MASNILPVRDGAITDWRFACGSSPEEIEGTLTAYKQATERNRVSREFGRAYMRLQYTLPASDTDVRLVLRTAHNPLRVDVDGQTALLNGYGDASFTGNSYQSISLKAGDERTLDIYLYAPLAFSLEAYVEPGEIAAGESFFRYIGFGVSAALLLFGAALFLFSLLLAARSEHIRAPAPAVRHHLCRGRGGYAVHLYAGDRPAVGPFLVPRPAACRTGVDDTSLHDDPGLHRQGV